MNCKDECKRWVISHSVDEMTKAQAILMLDDENQLESCFGSSLAFGTAGLRGIMGPGTNRMNINTVSRATKGIANYIVSLGKEYMERGVVIAHDSRNNGVAYAEATALTLCAMGIKTYVFDELRPTPELSFAVRKLGTIMGINITASHNPKEYNGYKVYYEDGAQIAGDLAELLQKKIAEVDPLDIERMDKEKAVEAGLYNVIGEEIDEAYLAAVMAEQLDMSALSEEARQLKVVYTPFHGTGYRLVPMMMRRLGINVSTVDEQMIPDGEFPTLKSPNPEEKDGFTLGIAKAKEVGADLIIATDPDADRVGVGCLDDKGEITLLSGNQIGVLLIDFIAKQLKATGKLPEKPAVVTSIVSTRMAQKICQKLGLHYVECLTGFKYIGENIAEFEKTGEYTFMLGFEESYGYLKGTYARDKDSVVATMLIAQMAMYYKDKGMTLPQGLAALYEEYGYYQEQIVSLTIGGTNPTENMNKIMSSLRAELPTQVGGRKALRVGDFMRGEYIEGDNVIPTGLPKSDVLHFTMDDGCTVIVRPSGTEPKVKLYILSSGKDAPECQAKIDIYKKEFGELLK
ncbi:MAG: phospho-sugar mutase [Clostridia bacterium]|nr:phospho-sugar mutase [Clostridia bacterium]